MKIYAEDDQGNRHEIKDISNLGKGNCLILQMNTMIGYIDLLELEQNLEKKTGKKIALIPKYVEVKGII